MTILGIDFGLKKIGVAIADGALAEPYLVVKYTAIEDLMKKLKRIVKDNCVERIVIGISDGDIARKAREFGKLLKEELSLPVEFSDETLTTYDAQRMAIEAGIKRSRRKGMEDAFAAAVMLQDYLDL